jgi:hypothetical protein
MAWIPGKFVWFEHISNNVGKAREFYGALFGWKTDPVDMGGTPYPMIQNGTEGIGGFRDAMAGVPNHWMSYMSVADVDASAKAAQQAGAKILMPPTDFSPVGRGATLADPQGAAFSIWKSADGDQADVERAPIGNWCWNELMTTDAGGALKFYESVFGYEHDTMPGPSGTYYLLKSKGVMRAGLMKNPQVNLPAFWLPYVAVADCEASVAKAKSLKAEVVVQPTDIPNMGRFAVLVDPLGAAVAVWRSAS